MGFLCEYINKILGFTCKLYFGPGTIMFKLALSKFRLRNRKKHLTMREMSSESMFNGYTGKTDFDLNLEVCERYYMAYLKWQEC